MLYINFSNVEKLIFENSEEIKQILPPYYWSFFEQWKLGKQLPMLKQVGKSAMLDFLNHIKDEDVDLLEEYFDERIVVEKLNYSTVQNLKIPISEKDICQKLCEVIGFNYFSTWRDDKFLYISFWR
tara:strand:- start:206 stop:583 length:378 start_codon:yes stop_codon:yes gene_type:complete